jgi:hypothetical protein
VVDVSGLEDKCYDEMDRVTKTVRMNRDNDEVLIVERLNFYDCLILNGQISFEKYHRI